MSAPGFKIDWDEATVKECVKLLRKKEGALKKLPNAVKKATDEALKVAKNQAPRKTGNLADSFKVEYSDGGRKVKITNEAKNSVGQYYAPFPEFGKGRGWSGKEKAFMRDGQKAGQEKLLDECKKILEES